MQQKEIPVGKLVNRRRKIIKIMATLRQEYDELTNKLKSELLYDINGNKED